MGGMLGTNIHFVIEVGDLVKTQDSVSVTIGLLWCSQFWLLYLRLAPRGCDTYYAGLQLVLLRPPSDGQHQDTKTVSRKEITRGVVRQLLNNVL